MPLLALVLGTLASPAIAHENPGAVPPDGRFTPNNGRAVFPPQPRGISNVRQYTPSAEEGGSLSTLVDEASDVANGGGDVDAPGNRGVGVGATRRQAVRAALGDSAVRGALGTRFSVLDSVRVRDKNERDKDRFQVEFFSLDNNQTVTVLYANERVEIVGTAAASDRQPPLSEPEMERAIELAREYWEAEGASRVDALTGYAIQTFENDGTPHQSRVAYVSFHTASPEPPELLTWVDLTTGQVFRAELAR